MTEEYGGVQTIERRSGDDRRASNWRDAVEAQRGAKVRQANALVKRLDALVTELRAAHPNRYHGHDIADRIAVELAMHREMR